MNNITGVIYQIQEEQIEELAKLIINMHADIELYKSIVESDEINIEYIRMINVFDNGRNYFLTVKGWEYTLQVFKIGYLYMEKTIGTTDIIALEGYPEEFWYMLLGYLDNHLKNQWKDYILLDKPCIKIDPDSLQIYLELNTNEFSIPESLSNCLIYQYNNVSRVYLNCLNDFITNYSGCKKVKGYMEKIWTIEGIDINELPIYFNAVSYILTKKKDLKEGSYFCVDELDKNNSQNRKIRLDDKKYYIIRKYMDENQIKEILKLNMDTEEVIEIEIKDGNIKKAWQNYYDSNYYEAINYLSIANDVVENDIMNLKIILKLFIYLKTMRIFSLREELEKLKKLNFLDQNIYNFFNGYCSICYEESVEKIKISKTIIRAIPFKEKDRNLVGNLIDIIENYDNLNYLLKYKDTKEPIEILILYKLFKKEKSENIFKIKFEDKDIIFPSSPELKEIIKKI